MHKCLGIALLALAAGQALAGNGGPPAAPAEAERLEVGLAVRAAGKDGGAEGLTATVTVKNSGGAPITVEHPGNRSAVVFFVTDALGNIVPPEGIGKADPGAESVRLAPAAGVSQAFPALRFITGSAHFGYRLRSGETYRVVALYRPHGRSGPGFCSRETPITVS